MKVAVFGIVVCALLVVEARERTCTMENRPMCASYHKTYSNECTMDAEATAMLEKGLVLETTTRGECTCDFECPRDIDRVCGSDGNFYPNECKMRKHACENQQWLETVITSMC